MAKSLGFAMRILQYTLLILSLGTMLACVLALMIGVRDPLPWVIAMSVAAAVATPICVWITLGREDINRPEDYCAQDYRDWRNQQ